MDDERFERLYGEYGPLVWSVIRKVGVQDSYDRDLFMEIWHAVRAALPSFEGRASISTWIGGIAYHKCRDHLRRRGREIPWDPHSFNPGARALWQRTPRRTPSPRRHAIRNEERALLAEAMDRLPPVQKRILELWMAGFKYRTIAEALNAAGADPVDASFVGKQLYMAKLALRAFLRGDTTATSDDFLE